MPTRRYAAFLRGIMPTNSNMAELVRAFEAAGFTGVKTVIASGNVIFDAPAAKEEALEKMAEAAMKAELGRVFTPMVRSIEHLEGIVEADPFAAHRLSKEARRVVSFVREPADKLAVPVELGRAKIIAREGREIFTTYLPEKTPVFMTLIEKTFGKNVTTRTWQTVERVIAKARAEESPAKKKAPAKKTPPAAKKATRTKKVTPKKAASGTAKRVSKKTAARK
jgi:uncharacterized protein (DUF1697 family)